MRARYSLCEGGILRPLNAMESEKLTEEISEGETVVINVLAHGEDRSLPQNDISHVWYNHLDKKLGTPAGYMRKVCKLEHGVPILKGENPDFRAFYAKAILHRLSYEEKVAAMEFVPVTSIMTKKQMRRYLDSVQANYAQQGIILE